MVNALSEWLEVQVKQDGLIHTQRYERGKPVTPLKVIGKTKKTGTITSFKPDYQIFEELEYNYEVLELRSVSYTHLYQVESLMR